MLMYGLIILFFILPLIFHLREPLSFLVSPICTLLNLPQPAEEEGRHHHQINQTRYQQEGTTDRLISKGREAQLCRNNILRIERNKTKDQHKSKNIDWLSIKKRIQHL